MDELIGRILSHYRIVEQIGAGGMGVVYRAHDETLDRDVAIKVLPAAASSDPQRLRRFEQEARTAGALAHPNIVAIYEFGEHRGAPYVVTELLEGRTLREAIQAGPISVRKALDYGVQVARGLAAAHERGIVHRDIKPENVFVTSDGRVKILDFGISKLVRPAEEERVEHAATQTTAGAIIGTTGYMAPEQIRGEPVDHRADLFALGAVLYEMVAGRRAFSGGTSADTMSAILTQEPPSLSGVRVDVPPDLDRAIERCLEKNPRERTQSAWDLAAELERLAAAGSAAGAAPTPLPGKGGGPGAAAGKDRTGGAPRWLAPAIWGLAALTLLAVAASFDLGGWRQRFFPAGEAAIRSIAVLPLQNLSGDSAQEYFVDGMTEELTAALAQVGALRIISRTSAMRYKNTNKALPEIGRELGVDAVVEGSVLRAGDQVRVTAQLIRTLGDEHLWAQSYERDLNDVLALQSGLAHLIAGEVAKVVMPGAGPRLRADHPVDPEAHDDYLMGRYYLNARTTEGFAKAIGYFQSAVERDSAYAPAWAAIANYYNVLPFWEAVPPRDAFPKAREAALRALALDQSLGEAHAALAFELAYYEWEWVRAEQEFRRALALVPSDANVHHSYSRYLVSLGRTDEGLAELKLAQELDPLSNLLKANEGMLCFFAGKYDDAMTRLHQVLALAPEHPIAHWGSGLILEQRGQFDEAVREIQRAMDPQEYDPNMASSIGHVYATAGMRDRARREIEELRRQAGKMYVSPYHIALIYAGLDEKDAAFVELDRAAEDRSTLLVYLKRDPRFANLHSDPRFQTLMNRIGLPG